MCEHNRGGICCACEADKCSRFCNNNCGRRLTVDSPNWFQCSERCRAEVWARNHPPEQEDDR